MRKKILKKEYDSICRVGTMPGTLYGNPEVHETVVSNTTKFWPFSLAINTATDLLNK